MPSALSADGVRQVWQPYYTAPLSDCDVTEIQTNVARLLAFLTRWASQQSMNTASNPKED